MARKSQLLNFTGVAGGQVSLLGPSESRKHVFFLGGVETGFIYLSDKPMTGVGQGLNLGNFISGVDLDVEVHGLIVCQPWYAWFTVATDSLVVIETVDG